MALTHEKLEDPIQSINNHINKIEEIPFNERRIYERPMLVFPGIFRSANDEIALLHLKNRSNTPNSIEYRLPSLVYRDKYAVIHGSKLTHLSYLAEKLIQSTFIDGGKALDIPKDATVLLDIHEEFDYMQDDSKYGGLMLPLVIDIDLPSKDRRLVAQQNHVLKEVVKWENPKQALKLLNTHTSTLLPNLQKFDSDVMQFYLNEHTMSELPSGHTISSLR